MSGSARVLSVDDAVSENAAANLNDAISVDQVADTTIARESVVSGDYDCVVTPGRVSAGNIVEFMALTRQLCPALPVVFVGPDETGSESSTEQPDGLESLISGPNSDSRDASESGLMSAVDFVPGGRRRNERIAAVIERTIESTSKTEELRRTKAKLEAFFEDSPDPAVEYEFEDDEPVIRSANLAFVDTFGYDRSVLVGRPMNDVIVPPEKEAEARALDERVKAGGRVDAELRRETTDGQREFLFKNIPVETDEDGPDGYALYIDISDQKAREQQLQEQNERLNDFASVVSHDLRSPMEVIKNRIEMTRHTGDMGQLDRAMEAIDRMDELLRELLQMARQGEVVGRTEAVSLSETAETAWTHVATGDATLVIEADASLMADYGRLTQLLENLYINAVDHNACDGSAAVTITVGQTDDADGFYVADDGRGIPPGERQKVFKSGYTNGTDGTGYGLTIVRQVARAHGWEVAISGSDGGGARFEFRGVEFSES